MIEKCKTKIQNNKNMAKNAKKRKILKTLISFCIIIAFLFGTVIVTKTIMTENKYKEAILLYGNGNYHEAAKAFESLREYKNSKNYLEKKELIGAIIANSEINDIVTFGKYEWYIININKSKIRGYYRHRRM